MHSVDITVEVWQKINEERHKIQHKRTVMLRYFSLAEISFRLKYFLKTHSL